MHKMVLFAYTALAISLAGARKTTREQGSSPQSVAEYIVGLGDGYPYVPSEDEILKVMKSLAIMKLIKQQGKDLGSRTTFVLT